MSATQDPKQIADSVSQSTVSVQKADQLEQNEAGSDEKRDLKRDLDVEADVESEALETPSQPISTWKLRWLRVRKHVLRAAVLLLVTGWWITGLALYSKRYNWVVPFLIWLAVSLRIFFRYVPSSLAMMPLRWVWGHTAVPLAQLVKPKLRLPAAALGTIAVIIVGSFVSPESKENTRKDRAVSLAGLVIFLGLLYATSRDRKRINWQCVIVGMLTQFLVATFVLRTKVGFDIFTFIAGLVAQLLGFSIKGVELLTASPIPELISTWWLVTVAPAIVFFVSIVGIMMYIGLLQWVVSKFATFFFWAMNVSGVEAVVAVATPFVGQGESALLVRDFVAYLTMAELHQVMTSGFSTIAGAVLIAYISMGINPQALVAACVMAIPGSLVVSKLRWPETEETLSSGKVTIPNDGHKANNIIEAFSNAAWFGLKIAGTIIAVLLCIISLVACIDAILSWGGKYLSIQDPSLTLDLIMGYLCYPVAFLLGVSREGDDILKVARLLGTKLITNEFVAYFQLSSNEDYDSLSSRSRIIVTYALCGFAGLGALGIQIGVLSQIAPNRSGDVSRVAISACICGAMSTFIGGCIAGLLTID